MTHLAEPLIRRLRISTMLAAEDIHALETLPMTMKSMAAQAVVVREGERPTQSCVLLEGFACRSKTTDAGKRQILSIHIAGDIPDLQSLHLHVMDHDLTTLSKCVVGFIPHDALLALTRARPLVAEALWHETLVDAAIFREWIVNVGRRPATKRLAHLIAELGTRLEAIGLSVDGHFELPMTQLDLADALGLTPVHLNRVLQELRHRNLLELRKHAVVLRDVDELKKLGDFDELYLHQGRSS